ncbi:UDP-4-amino-4,6-dideoxy-N-acetyl-beta-L-altrosamine transaminase [Marinicauda salina]|uniref:UDP-4-amino-4, 6-dideoxy-N-acetyl-beta-L-altrosamine transaminase n=1 Tax=Marinicauda salina TaxID=2135793 RepID=A0A2U2BU98_9PROT|nr:UDP-4-amino-4,6-dideoxy-N-acetyl-beta-L-altrosamine transaminase [Marinicauda salina]PWE17572.1 UDP-4-amino-4,6-dideoxy-N-acetyl-beta-L-altrosamine transaminase [Marinicauda salina]
MSEPFLPYGRQQIDEDDVAAVVDVLRGDFLTTGPAVPAFEADLAGAVGAPHAVACNSGTAALHLALAALGVGEGDVCIVPAITFMATANAAAYCGADVVFADVDSETGLLTPHTLSEALDRAEGRVKAVLPVHLGGVVCDRPGIRSKAERAGAFVVEDSCHALGSVAADGGVVGDGAFAEAATFSFHPVKTIASGEGGMVTTRDPALAERMRLLRSHGIERDPARFQRAEGRDEPWWHEMQALGWNHRMSDIAAALGRSQLAKLDRFAQRRRRLAGLYADALAPLAPVVRPPATVAGCDPCRHLMNVRIDFDAAGVSRADVMTRLRARGVGSQVHYIPVHRQPWWAARVETPELPGAERYYARMLSLPLFPAMSDEDPARVAASLKEALGV